MATIKSYTDIEQSKKLVEILPLESADMYYEERCNLPKAIIGSYSLHIQCRATDKDYKKLTYPILSPCWSLAALLGVIPNYNLSSEHNCHTCTAETSFGKETVAWFESPIDACYKMILKLHELKML